MKTIFTLTLPALALIFSVSPLFAEVRKETIQKCQAALEEIKADWQMIYYSGAKHSFTNPGADQAGLDGLKYDPNADQRSWRHMQDFFNELFGAKK
ncbi:MAG: dienelactone hydrolase family protein [Planctomycetes bacterium]|nr:dienelactone hydrolase family protein [Planctomycetota bacterium]